MISIELWRAKIGLFNCRRSCSRVFRLPSSSNLFAGDYRFPSVWSLGVSSSSILKRRALVLLLVVVIAHLLLSSGDVERNPGPSKDKKPVLDQLQCMCYTNQEKEIVYFRLMDRIEPKWIKLAVALKFPMYRINTFKHDTDPVVTLLSEWLKGGNKDEDSRSITWGTLITALRYAGLEEEAEIIERQFFVTVNVQEPVSQKELSHRQPKLISKEKSDYKAMCEQQQLQVKEAGKEKFQFQEKSTKLERTIEMLQETASDLKAEMQAEIKTYQEKIAAKHEELERVQTSVQRDRSDLIADKFAVLKRELKMLQKLSFDLEEKLEDLEREVEGKEKDGAQVVAASGVQEDVQSHTTDDELSDAMPPHKRICMHGDERMALPITELNSEITEEEKSCVDAFKNGNKQVAEQLITSHHLHPAAIRTKFILGDRSANTATAKVSLLHLAAYWGWKDIAILLSSEYNCDANWKDDAGQTPLYYSVYNGHLELVKYFITEQLLNPMDRNKNSNTLLHCACENGHLNIIQYLIWEVHCNPSCENNIGNTPLHLACENGHLNIVQYLISEIHCNPSCVNNHGTTPLHEACLGNHAHIVQYLLSTGHVNPLAEDQVGSTPLSFATDKYDIIKLLQPYADCSRDYPVHTFTKVILTGNSGAGKTTIAQLITILAGSAPAVDYVAEVKRFMAGIIPHHIESNFGNFVVYDFAGQQEYYSSHAAILEQVMRKSAAMFICMVDLSKSNESICESLQYWLSFISNACRTVEERSHVAIVGSHADLVRSSTEMEEKSSLVHKMASVRVKHQNYAGYITMDCRQADTDASRVLVSVLTNSQKAIISSLPAISPHCHLVYAFLCSLNVVACTLQHLISTITHENDSTLPSDLSILTEFLTTLSDKGLILFLKHLQSSWIVIKTEILLNEINGTLFAPQDFIEHCDLASNTGIVPTSNLLKVFPQHSPEMLLGFLNSLDFCQPVDHLVLQYTNLQATIPSHSTADLLFFPGLVQSERPDNLSQMLQGTLQFGWCLGCVDDHQFLNSHFLRVLLLSVAYKFSLSCQSSRYQRKCTIWRNGISWTNNDDITAVVELLNKNRQVLVAMSYIDESREQFAKLRGSIITLLRHLQQELCASVEVREFLISPDHVQQYPFDNLPCSTLFDMYQVARSILCHKPVVLSYKDGKRRLKTQSIHFEPYHLLTPCYVCQLFNPSVSYQPVPSSLLHKVRKFCGKSIKNPQVYMELREYLDSLSVFAGSNPLEVAELREEELPICDTAEEVSATASDILSIDDLFKVKKMLKTVIDWQSLGLALGLPYPTLKRIDEEQRGFIENCKIGMLAAWLQQKDCVTVKGVPSWLTLKTALIDIGENELADTITT